MAAAGVAQEQARPDLLTLAAFVGVVVFGGANFVAAHFSNQELPPSFGAGLRFAGAALVFLALVAVRRIPLPQGQALLGTVLFGILLAPANALAFWAILRLPAAVAGVIFASVPLFTLFFALLHGLEAFRWRGLIGGLLAIAGIGVIRNAPLSLELPLISVLAVVVAAACAAEAGVVIKKFPPSHPVATNGLAMAIAALLLFVTSMILREPWSIPSRQATWAALGHLVLLGSVALLSLYLYILKRWTASGASYQIVLMPLVTLVFGAWLADQPITAGVMLGGAVVLAGVYVGALSHPRVPIPTPPNQEALAQRCSTC